MLEGWGRVFRLQGRTADDPWHAKAIVDQPQGVCHAHMEGCSIEIDKQSSNERPFERARPFRFFRYGEHSTFAPMVGSRGAYRQPCVSSLAVEDNERVTGGFRQFEFHRALTNLR